RRLMAEMEVKPKPSGRYHSPNHQQDLGDFDGHKQENEKARNDRGSQEKNGRDQIDAASEMIKP
ncbi:MAG: hypothetical protein ABIP48_11460, partial [Planctomycetota bacterium]